MKSVVRSVALSAIVWAAAAVTGTALAADDAKPAASEPAKSAEAAAGSAMKPIDRVKATEEGKLKNPFTDKPEAIEEGRKLYLANSCNGCHGGNGGGGMCPPLTNEVWVYGSDDDTLFRLITLGTKELQATGRKRKGTEGVVGPMPPYADIITDEEKLWKIIAFIRSVYNGSPSRRNW